MAIGRTFQESLQKALRSLEVGTDGLDPLMKLPLAEGEQHRLREELRMPGPNRIRYVGDAFRAGLPLDEVHSLSRIDPWFLAQIEEIVREEHAVQSQGLEAFDRDRVRALKRKGFSDRRLATLAGPGRDQRAPPPRHDGHPSGLQARRHLRRGVRHLDGVHVLDLRRGVRGSADRTQEDHDPRRRAEPHRAGHRVRLLLRARRAGAARGRLRDDHGQLQSGDGLDRLRHLRPPVLRAAHARRRHGDHRQGEAGGRDRAVRRPDAAEAVPRARGCRRADHRHYAGLDRHRRGSRALPAAGAPSA